MSGLVVPCLPAAEYMNKFEHTSWPMSNVNKLKANVPLINVLAIDLVWPPRVKEYIDLLLSSLHIDANRSMLDQYQDITSLIQRILASDDPARTLPNFHGVFPRALLQDQVGFLTCAPPIGLLQWLLLMGSISAWNN